MAGSDVSDSSKSADRIATEEEFQSALQAVVTEADANGVDVRGGWPVFGEGEDASWDVEVTPVASQSRAEIRDTEFPASSVVEAVGARKGVDAADLPPLYDAIGPDIIETIHEADGDSRQAVTFEYVGYLVTVNSDGSIVIEE